jgi:hypothetical protein
MERISGLSIINRAWKELGMPVTSRLWTYKLEAAPPWLRIQLRARIHMRAAAREYQCVNPPVQNCQPDAPSHWAPLRVPVPKEMNSWEDFDGEH